MKLTLALAAASTIPVVAMILIDGSAPDTGAYFQVRQWVVGEDYTGLMPFNFRPPLIGVVLMCMNRVIIPLWAVAAVVIALTSLSYFLSAHSEGGPDNGSYLQTRNWIEGRDYTGLLERHYRPLLVGLCLSPLAIAFGDVGAGRVMTIVSLLGVVWASYYLARAWLSPNRAAWACVLFAVWGVPVTHNLIAGYLPVLAVAISFVLVRLVVTPCRASWWGVPLASFLLAGFNQTIPVTMAVVILMLPIWTRQQWGLLGIGVLAALPWLPFALVSGMGAGTFAAFDWNYVGITTIVRTGFARLNTEWLSAIIVLPPVLMLTEFRGRSPVVWALVGSLLLSLVVVPSVAVNNAFARFALYVPMFMAIHMVWAYGDWVAGASRHWKAVVAVALACSWLLHSISAVDNSNRYQVLTEDRLSAIEYLGEVSAPTDHIASFPQNVGHWIGGVTGRLWSMPWQYTPPKLYREESADLYCLLGITSEWHHALAWMDDFPPCAPDNPTRYKWIVSDFEPPNRLWPPGSYPDPRKDPTAQGLDLPRLTEVKRFGSVGVYRVSGPHLPDTGIDRSKGRSWPWEAFAQKEGRDAQ